MKKRRQLSRRDFLKLAGAGLGGSILACGRSDDMVTSPGSGKSALPEVAKTPVPVITQGAKVFEPGTMADQILINGKVLTVDAVNSEVQAVAVAGDRIVKTGTNEDVQTVALPDANVIDLNGRTVTPGLIDSHLHFRGYGLTASYYTPFMPPDVVDIPSMQQYLADLISGLGPGAWIVAYYMGFSDKPIPTKEDLDPVSPDNPVFMMHIGGHWGTANSAALSIADIDRSTRNPEGGIIEKKEGEVTGVLYNHRAMDMLRVHAPPITDQLVRQSIVDTQVLMASCGMTCFHDNNVRGLDALRAYQELSAQGALFLRNNLYLTMEWPQDLELLDQVDMIRNDVTRFEGYKFLIDGQGPTAFTHEPHNGHEWQMTTWEPQMFKDAVKLLHDTGLQICVHCIGDAATDLVLDAYEGAMNTNPRFDPRHRIEHAVLTRPESTPRMRDLGVVLSTQPAFIYLFGDGWRKVFGNERMDRMMVTREWLESGVHLTIGSDAPSTPFYNPQASLAGAMNRLTLSNNSVAPDQGLTFTEALRAHTIESAYAAHQEHVLGSLEAGKFADLVVWQRDPTQLTIKDLALTTRVDLTMVGGRVVYQA